MAQLANSRQEWGERRPVNISAGLSKPALTLEERLGRIADTKPSLVKRHGR
jgi:hypothetical protein